MQNCGVNALPLDFKDQYFGCEIEMTGLTRKAAAQALARLFHTNYIYCGGDYDVYEVRDEDGKECYPANKNRPRSDGAR